MKKIIFILPLLMAACASFSPQKYTGNNGKAGYSLICSEFNTTWEQCLRKAGDQCAAGYELDKKLSYTESFPDSGDGIYRPANNHLAVLCKG